MVSEKRKIYWKKYYAENHAVRDAYNKKYTEEHPEERKAYTKKYREMHRQEANIYGKKYYKEHSCKIGTYGKKFREELKEEVLTHYGNGKLQCVFCHDTRIHVLTIDHINGKGGEHVGGNRIKRRLNGKELYRWLRQNGYPAGFRTLCMNCQVLAYRKNMGADIEIWDWNQPHIFNGPFIGII